MLRTSWAGLSQKLMVLVVAAIGSYAWGGPGNGPTPEEWESTGLRLSILTLNARFCYQDPTGIQFVACMEALNTLAGHSPGNTEVLVAPAGDPTVKRDRDEVIWEKNGVVLVNLSRASEERWTGGAQGILARRARKKARKEAWHEIFHASGMTRKGNIVSIAHVAKVVDVDELVALIIERNGLRSNNYREAVATASAITTFAIHSEDAHSYVLPEQTLKRMYDNPQKKFGGIGAHIGTNGSHEVTLFPVESWRLTGNQQSPAGAAGIRAGDVLTHIIVETGDLVSVANLPVGDLASAVQKLLVGTPGTTVTLRVKSNGTPEPRDVPVVRQLIQYKIAAGRPIATSGENPVVLGYVEISQFTAGVAAELESEAKALIAGGAKGLILDFRRNPGGLLTEAISMVDVFAKAGITVVTSRDEAGNILELDDTPDSLSTKTNEAIVVPLGVLIDPGSASASEIVSGALRDLNLESKQYYLIGERSYGKATVQAFFPLKVNTQIARTTKAKTLIARTISRYYLKDWTPQIIGVTPDFIVYPKPDPSEDDKVHEREEDIDSPGLLGARSEAQPAPSPDVESHFQAIRDCLGETSGARARFRERSKGDGLVPSDDHDYQLLSSTDILACHFQLAAAAAN